MEITFLGTGTGAPSKRRGSPGLAVKAGSLTLLFDSGPGVMRQLTRAGLSFNDLDHIFYTHYHPDHATDLISYLFATRYDPGFTRPEPCRIYGPAGLLELNEHLLKAFGHYIEPPEGMVVFTELPPGHILNLNDIIIETGPIDHKTESLGYRLTQSDGVTLAITGDTDYGPELIDLARNADLLITECSFPEGMKKKGHLTPSLAGTAAREAGAKALALTHFYPECDGQDLLSPVTGEFGGPVILAEDLLRLEL